MRTAEPFSRGFVRMSPLLADLARGQLSLEVEG